ncbi:MAG: peptide chain release factor-like protein [Gemmataceae bacterium]|nr:peptide chain release factor-like protein [Gemmata sp.]MDW8198323.1 peptide chain release factor-like protein [Gemmataceae bacterium]
MAEAAAPRPARSTWSQLTDDELLAQCAVDTYRARGPGGQKRNKTSSAVRLRHRPSGLMVIAEESRSQHENKAKALKRLRQALFLEWREALPPHPTPAQIAALPELAAARAADGRLHLSRNNPLFWPVVGVVLDVLAAVQARVSDAAELLQISTGNLIDFLQTDAKVWQAANRLRAMHGHKPLR